MSDGVRRIGPEELGPGQGTPGMLREEAFATEGMWAGMATTEPGVVSGWHHHGEYESTIYVLSGAFRMEFGPGGRETFDAIPGDFIFVGKGEVHRESNPSPEPSRIVVVRSGHGDAVINVPGPPA